MITRIFQGGFDQLHRAGVALLGGHTVQDPEIKFGYAVTGAIDPERILTNAGARPGDVLFLTKPLGTGIVATALKFDRIDAACRRPAIESMRTLNRAAAEALASRFPRRRFTPAPTSPDSALRVTRPRWRPPAGLRWRSDAVDVPAV